jgi:hypothetical protein
VFKLRIDGFELRPGWLNAFLNYSKFGIDKIIDPDN